MPTGIKAYSAEWYTPVDIIRRARETLGTIDLDPCSCLQAQRDIQAGQYLDVDDDGLSQDWFGNVYVNPPGKTDLVKAFWHKGVREILQGRVKSIIWCGFSHDQLFLMADQTSHPLNFPTVLCTARIRFNDVTGMSRKQPPKYQYFSLVTLDGTANAETNRRFKKVWGDLGWCNV